MYVISFSLLLIISYYYKFILKDINNRLTINRVSLAIEFILLSLFYYQCITSKLKKYFFPLAIISFLILSYWDFTTSKPGEFNFILLVTECLFFLIIIVYFFYEKLKYNFSVPIYYSPEFWVSVAFLIYFSGNFFLFLFSRPMFNDANFKIHYTLIYSTVTIIKNIFLCTAIVVNKDMVNYQKKRRKLFNIDLDSFYQVKNLINQR